nr:ferredoxin--NADP reductase [Gordonia rhizosphera]
MSRQNGDRFRALRVKGVVCETSDAVSLVLDVPATDTMQFRYRAGQFITINVEVGGCEYLRCYSMSSSPLVGKDLRITVKRDRDGVVSNWINDHVQVGDQIWAARPSGRFVLAETAADLVAFAGGSGVTPVFSLISAALQGTTRTVRLFYANRSRDSVIFGDALDDLAVRHPGRLVIHHHFDEDSGLVTGDAITSFLADVGTDADHYICGPSAFMDTAESTLAAVGTSTDRIHLERFSAAVPAFDADSDVFGSTTTEVTIRLDRRTTTVPYRTGHTLLQSARSAGLRAPSSCETGSCATCMARVIEGSVRMLNNDALDDDEVAEGYILTCQSVPTSPTISVVYE